MGKKKVLILVSDGTIRPFGERTNFTGQFILECPNCG